MDPEPPATGAAVTIEPAPAVSRSDARQEPVVPGSVVAAILSSAMR